MSDKALKSSDLTYEARERQLLQQLAWQTVADPKASDEDRKAARQRLEPPEGTKFDWDRLSADELALNVALNKKARGIWPPVMSYAANPSPATHPSPRLSALYRFASLAQIVADDARLELDSEFKNEPDGPTTYHIRRHPTRCEACGRYEDDGCRIGSDSVDVARRDRAQEAAATRAGKAP